MDQRMTKIAQFGGLRLSLINFELNIILSINVLKTQQNFVKNILIYSPTSHINFIKFGSRGGGQINF